MTCFPHRLIVAKHLVSLLLGLLAAHVAAASPSADTEENLRRQIERSDQQLQQLLPQADVLQAEARSDFSTTLPQETPCFVINTIRFQGKHSEHFDWLLQQAQVFLGQCVGKQGLRHLVAFLDAHLIQQGYATTRSAMPPQNLQDGNLIISLHVGVIGEIRMLDADNNPPTIDQRWGTWHNAFPIEPGAILNIRDLEQGVEQMNRLASQNVTTKIVPGKAADHSNIIILRHHEKFAKRLRGTVGLDNSGSSNLGRTWGSASLTLDNPLGINDNINLAINSNTENLQRDRRSQSLAVAYSVPQGKHTLSFSYNYNTFAQAAANTFRPVVYNGESDSGELKLIRTLRRSASSKSAAFIALSIRHSNNRINSIDLNSLRRRTTNLDWGFTHMQHLPTGKFEAQISYRHGLDWFNAQKDYPPNLYQGLTLRPDILRASVSYTQPLYWGKQKMQYELKLRAQYTQQTTTALDQIAIGSRYSVRGFDGDQVLLAENGYVLRNEWQIPVSWFSPLSTTAFIGLDWGQVWGPSAKNLVGRRLVGFALGLRSRVKKLLIDFTLATPLDKPALFNTTSINPYIALLYNF